ncbi:helix-turn-helix domain-containing protein [Clostridium yunnanense]|uniref:helix-turn-helix domain-containing protein n=1 Tax=Clostridium yunnanense TaxID=2800325 RepID=UPI001FAB49A4|nr:helix-turn-helix transcriptional regulator [Clostridium yunnanense]
MNDKDLSNVIDRIKNRRLALGLSYQDMQDLTGISKSTWQRYETGFIKNLAIDKLDLVAKALKTTPSYLMGWNEETEKENKEFTTAKEATEYLLKLPSMAAFGGYDINKMSDEEIIEFANELLHQFELISHKYKK